MPCNFHHLPSTNQTNSYSCNLLLLGSSPLGPRYSITIKLKEELEELKEGGGEDIVDSSESDEPKVKLKKVDFQFNTFHIRWVLAWTSFPERGRRFFT